MAGLYLRIYQGFCPGGACPGEEVSHDIPGFIWPFPSAGTLSRCLWCFCLLCCYFTYLNFHLFYTSIISKPSKFRFFASCRSTKVTLVQGVRPVFVFLFRIRVLRGPPFKEENVRNSRLREAWGVLEEGWRGCWALLGAARGSVRWAAAGMAVRGVLSPLCEISTAALKPEFLRIW